jgi:hypothetical protein
MSITYLEVLCLMEQDSDSYLMDSGEESGATKVVRTGMNLGQSKNDTSFWQNFMNLTSDSEGMADLLGVKPAEVRRWSEKIRFEIQQIQKSDSANPEGDDNNKVIPTGDDQLTVDDIGMTNL